jgi:hypothetical protein
MLDRKQQFHIVQIDPATQHLGSTVLSTDRPGWEEDPAL